LTQRGGELDRQPHIRMLILQRDDGSPDVDILKSSIAQHAVRPLTCIKITSSLLKRGEDRLFQAIPCLMVGKTVPTGGIGFLDRDDSSWSSESDHLPQKFFIPPNWGKDEANMHEVKHPSWEVGLIGILFHQLNVGSS